MRHALALILFTGPLCAPATAQQSTMGKASPALERSENFVWENFRNKVISTPGIMGRSASGYDWQVLAGFGDDTNNLTIVDGALTSKATVHNTVGRIVADSTLVGVPIFTRIGATLRWHAGTAQQGGNQDVILYWGDSTFLNSTNVLGVFVQAGDTLQIIRGFLGGSATYILSETLPTSFGNLTNFTPVEASFVSNSVVVTVGPYTYSAVFTNLGALMSINRYAGICVFGASNVNQQSECSSAWVGWARQEHFATAGFDGTLNTNFSKGLRCNYRPATTGGNSNQFFVTFRDLLVGVGSPSTSTTRVTNYLPNCWTAGVEPGTAFTFFDSTATASGSNIVFGCQGGQLLFAPGEATVGTNFARLNTDNGFITWTATPRGYHRTQ